MNNRKREFITKKKKRKKEKRRKNNACFCIPEKHVEGDQLTRLSREVLPQLHVP